MIEVRQGSAWSMLDEALPRLRCAEWRAASGIPTFTSFPYRYKYRDGNLIFILFFMDLTLQKLDSRNNTFLTADGLPLYHITTPLKFRGSTTIQKFDGPSSVQMGTVELHTFGRNVVVVWGRDMVPHKSSNVLSQCVYIQSFISLRNEI